MDIATAKQVLENKIKSNKEENEALQMASDILNQTFAVEFINLDSLTAERDQLAVDAVDVPTLRSQVSDLTFQVASQDGELQMKTDKIAELAQKVVDLGGTP